MTEGDESWSIATTLAGEKLPPGVTLEDLHRKMTELVMRGVVQRRKIGGYAFVGNRENGLTVQELNAAISDAMARVPPECRETATIRFHTFDGKVSADIHFSRPQTDEEWMSDVRAEAVQMLRNAYIIKNRPTNVLA